MTTDLHAHRAASRKYVSAPRRLRRQSGVVLFIALIVMVAMALAGIALFKQVGMGLQLAGNLSFKQGATAAADLGTEAARTWLIAQNNTTLSFMQPTAGYDSTWNFSFDPLNPATFNGIKPVTLATDAAGNTVSYVIHRLCANDAETINDPNQSCVTLGQASAGGSQAAVSYGISPLGNTIQPYFRVTSYVSGPRNTSSIVQVIMY
jgi:type IV pilus assembly protein PilX